MQPIQSYGTSREAVVEERKQVDQPVPEVEVHDSEKAKAQQELFNMGVQSGGVVMVQHVATTQERLTEFMKGVLDEIGLGVQQQGLVSFLQVTSSDIEALTEYKERASEEEHALFTHFTRLIMAHYSPIVSQLPEQFRPQFLAAIQNAIIPKMAHAHEEIKKIAPEFLKNLVSTASFHEYIARQGEVMQKLQALEPTVLKSLQDALTSDDKEGFIAESTLEAVIELKAFLESLPEEIRGALKEGFVEGIRHARGSLLHVVEEKVTADEL